MRQLLNAFRRCQNLVACTAIDVIGMTGFGTSGRFRRMICLGVSEGVYVTIYISISAMTGVCSITLCGTGWQNCRVRVAMTFCRNCFLIAITALGTREGFSTLAYASGFRRDSFAVCMLALTTRGK